MTDPQLEDRLRAWFQPLAGEVAPTALRTSAARIPREHRRSRWFGLPVGRVVLAFAAIAVSAAVMGGLLNAGGPPARSLATTGPAVTPALPALPRNGEIAFSARGQIVVVNADGTNRHVLGIDGWSAYEPAWSPDGSKIAFLGRPCSAPGTCAMSPGQLHGGSVGVMNGDGSGMSIVATGVAWPGAFAWRPDGSLMLPTGNIVEAAYGSPPVRIIRGRLGIWSPDGAFFAYGDGAGVHVLDVVGGSDRLVIADGAAVPVQWLPDDSGLAFVIDLPNDPADSGSWMIDRSGGNRQLVPHVTAQARFVGWAPGGRLLAFVERGGNVVIARADGSLRWGAPSLPTWSPDGTRVLVSSGAGLAIELELVTDLTVPVPLIEIPASSVLGASWQALP